MAGVLSAGAVCAQEADPNVACCAMMPGMMPGMMGAHKGELREWHQQMMEKIKAQDAEMDKLVQDMNAATGEKKVDAIAAIINKAMEHRKAWHQEMEARHKKLMEWMESEKGKMQKENPPAGSENPKAPKKGASPAT